MAFQQPQAFRATIRERPVIGPFSKFSDPAAIEILGSAGYDFVILDMEHGPNGLETMQSLIRAAEYTGIVPIVRVPENEMTMISRVLDIGAAGVQVPQISTASQVREVVSRARFAPIGERGVCRFVRAAGYSSTQKGTYFEQANQALIVLQLEGEDALHNLDAILDEPGPDIIFIGPYDLSQSLGVPGQVDHPLVIEKTRQIVEACTARGITTGNFTETLDRTRFWVSQGLRYMSFSVDVGLLYEHSRQNVSAFREMT